MTSDPSPKHDVTALEALSGSNSVFRSLLEAAPDAMVVADPNGFILLVNSQVEKLFGWKRGDLIGLPVERLIPKRHHAAHREHRGRYLINPQARGMGVGRNLSGLRRDGREFPVDVGLSPMEYLGQRLVIAAVRDITERRRTEAEHDAFFRLTLDMLYTASFDGYLKQLNPMWEKVLGWSLEELRASPSMDFVHPDDREKSAAAAARIINGGIQPPLENRYRCKDGSYRVLQWTGVASQELKLLLGAARDITGQKENEQILEDNRRKLAEAQEIAHVGSWDWDVRANRVTWTDELYRIYGYEPGAFELSYERFLGFAIPEDRERINDIVQRAYATGEFTAYEHRIQRSDGTVRVIHAEGRVDRDESGQPVRMAGIAQDITERVQAQAELAARAEELIRSNQELEQFAYVASHDLQEPLRTVGSYVQLLAKKYAGVGDARVTEYTRFITDGVQRMQALIEDLLAYSRVGRRQRGFKQIDLNPVLDQALVNLGASIAECRESITHDTLPSVWGDDFQLVQVFQNLIGNAIKYRGKEPPCIHIGARRQDGAWLVSIQDNGLGLEPEHFEKIFVIFQRLHSREHYPGTGIGLAVCKKIVQNHGGRIWVESAGLGKGSTFYFTLPAQKSA